MAIKIELDCHNLVRVYPTIISDLSRTLCLNFTEVHLILGERITTEFIDVLRGQAIQYTELFSIADYLEKESGMQLEDDEFGPIIDRALWDSTKADYCTRKEIELHMRFWDVD